MEGLVLEISWKMRSMMLYKMEDKKTEMKQKNKI